MRLDREQLESLREHGFVHIPAVVPEQLVLRARRALNICMGRDGVRPSIFREYGDGMEDTSEIGDLLFASPLWSLVRSLVSPDASSDGAQIALRFPQVNVTTAQIDTEASPEKLVRMTPHIDGIKKMPSLGLPKPVQLRVKPGDVVIAHYLLGHGIAQNFSPTIRYTVYFRATHPERNITAGRPVQPRERYAHPFTALIGVQLSELSGTNAGNLVVWPGSHKIYHSYYVTHPAEAHEQFYSSEFLADLWSGWEGVAAQEERAS